MKPTLLVLAAGMGSRYGGLKQLDQVGPSGETIIDYSIFDAIRAGFGKVVFIIRRDIEDAFKEAIGSRYEGKIKVEYAFQQLDALLPEGFSVPRKDAKNRGVQVMRFNTARELINEPFAVINGDDFYGREGFQLLADYLSQAKDGDKADFSMCGIHHAQHAFRQRLRFSAESAKLTRTGTSPKLLNIQKSNATAKELRVTSKMVP